MAFKFNESKKGNDSEKKNVVITTSRIKYAVIAGVLLLAAAVLLGLAIWTGSGQDEDNPETDADTLYSAARFFCRMKYPDNWEVKSDENGFYLNDDTGLIFQVYPYTTEPVEIVLPEGATMPPTTPSPAKIPTDGVMVSVFYQPNPDFSWPVAETLPPEVTPSPTPKISPEPTPTLPPYDISIASQSAVNIMKTKVLPAVSIEGGPEFSFSQGTPYEGKNCSFMGYSYQYTDETGAIVKGDMYVCTRAMAYYMITFEAKADLYEAYRPGYMSMVDNFIFSIFDF